MGYILGQFCEMAYGENISTARTSLVGCTPPLPLAASSSGGTSDIEQGCS